MIHTRMRPLFRPAVRGGLALALAIAVASTMPIVASAQAGGGSAIATTSAISAPDSSAVVATVERLHTLLAAGDSAAVLSLLTPDVAVLESGGYEDFSEFRAHHLPADIEFAKAVKSNRTLRSVRVVGDAAWVASTSVTQGQFRGRAINSAGAELIVLRRTDNGWRIAAIHWSSRARRN